MRRYLVALFIFSILVIVFGLFSGKISAESFQYISLVESFFTIFRILVVVLVLLLGLVILFPAILMDLILLLISNYGFEMTNQVLEHAWKNVTLGWFWNQTSGSSILFSAIIIAIITGILMRRR